MNNESTKKPYNKNKPKEEDRDGLSKRARRVKDPIRCPLCLKTLLIPRDSYPEEQMVARLEKCVLAQADSPCGKALANPTTQAVASLILKRTTRSTPPRTYRSSSS